MESDGLGATATSVAAPSAPCSRDVEAEKAALSLARRRGKCAPSVDTKLADAWLGFYVALTKSSSRSTEAATQASTDAVTETTLSDAASSAAYSPRRHAVPDGDAEEATSEPLTSDTLRESWADASEELSPSPKKRSRRSHRRRRTRGRGKKGRGSNAGDCPEEECSPIDEEEDIPPSLDSDDRMASVPSTAPAVSPSTPSNIMSTGLSTPTANSEVSPQWPFQAAQESNGCPRAVLPSEAAPAGSPSKALTGPTGLLTSTSPHAVHIPALCEASARTPCEASARTPPRLMFSGSPVAHMMPSTPTSFGSLTYQGGHASFHGSHMLLASPGSVCVASPCQGQAMQAPTFFGTSQQGYMLPCAADPYSMGMPDPMADTMRSFLTGGTPYNDVDLAIRLQAAAPETYED